jgi:FKBP-type peptidyl-prolyl cis-trans isomerase
MSQNKIIAIITGSTLLVVGLGAGGWWMWHNHQTSLALSSQNVSTLAADASTSTGSTGNLSATSGQSIPLNGPTPAPSQNSSGLNVTNGAGNSSMGQLDPKASVNTNNNTNSSSSSSSSNNGPDPTTFAQYDKYKDSPDAMFGEIQAGTGAALTANSKAIVYYKGWLTNGALFDESKTGSDGKLQPFSFTEGAGQVIRGWEQGVSGMKVGGTRLIIVPPKLGYGASGQGPIPGNAVLVFEVQLIAIQ